jgi:hypothetical protein
MNLPQKHRDTETGKEGDKGTRRKIETHLVSLSPFLLVLSSLWLCGSVA